MVKKKSEHYVNNKQLLEALIVYRAKVQDAKEKGLDKPRITNYLGECFLKIATHLSYKPNFVNYMFRDDMISDEHMIKFYNKYLNEEDVDIELDGKVSLNTKMGLVSTVEDARQSLEKIFKLNKDKPTNP